MQAFFNIIFNWLSWKTKWEVCFVLKNKKTNKLEKIACKMSRQANDHWFGFFLMKNICLGRDVK